MGALATSIAVGSDLVAIEIGCWAWGEGLIACVGSLGFAVDGARKREVQPLAMLAAEDLEIEDVTIERMSVAVVAIAPAPIARLDLTAAPAPVRIVAPMAIVKAGSLLSRRERDVMTLVCEGYSNKAIADELGISEHTVHFHVSNAIARLSARNRTHAAVLCVRRELAEA